MMSNDKMSPSMKTKTTAWQLTRFGLLATLTAIALSGCGGGAATTSQVQQSGGGTTSTNIVKPTADGDMAKFRDALWVNIDNPSNRCGQCHAPGKAAGSYPFANINDLAGSYNTANQDKYINRTFPAQSGLVKKVAAGHNCWADTTTCVNSLTQWITDWVQSSVPAGTNPLATLAATQLTAPNDQAVGISVSFPPNTNIPATYNAVHQLFLDYGCNGCHVPTVAQAQQPYFAVNDITASYDAVVSNAKINLVNPDQSRLYLRLANDHHNCGPGGCTTNSAAMLAAITAMANALTSTAVVDPELITSRAVNLYVNGLSASSGPRVEDAQIALYDFKENGGATVTDTSSYGAPYNLSITGSGSSYQWLASWGLHITGTDVSILGGAITNTKLMSLYPNATTNSGSNGYTIEAWVIPDNTNQQTNIVGISQSSSLRNVSLSQYKGNYQVFNRQAGDTVLNGDVNPPFRTGKLLSSLQHVVTTYTPGVGRRVYVDGVYTGDADPIPATDLSNWSDSTRLVLGNENGNPASAWLGTIRKVAIHKRALTANEIQENFASGVGQKYLLMFDVSTVSGVPDSYIYMQVQEYDDYSYLFYKPTYINLRNPSALPSDAVGLVIKGMRIGINGREASIGQAFGSVDSTINATDYIPGNVQDSGQVLSYVGTVIPKDHLDGTDMLFLTFETIGTTSSTKDYNPQYATTPPPPNHQVVSDVMIHTFEEINASLSTLTGIPRTTASIGGATGTYTTIYQQLPPAEAIDGFLASQQMAITQLAIQYCSVLVDDTAKRVAYFPQVNFSGMDFSNATNQDYVISPLLVKALNDGENLASQPTPTSVRTELRSLMSDLSVSCSGACSPTRTVNIVKATCTAAIAGAPMLLQ